MRKAITAITFFDMVFLLVLSISGSIGGVAGNIVYYFAFIIPGFLAVLYFKSAGNEEIKPTLLKLLPDRKTILSTLPLVAPFIGIVFLVSFLTSLLLNAFGFSDTTDVSGNIVSVVIRHAVIPAFLEEALFRFIPIMLLVSYSKKNALVIPSLMFAFVHCNLFQIPYALIAGFILSFIAIGTGSIFPCILIHFVNNVASIVFMRYAGVGNFNLIFFSVLALLIAVSIAVIILQRRKYKEFITEIKADKSNVEFTSPVLLFTAMTLVMGVAGLWMKL